MFTNARIRTVILAPVPQVIRVPYLFFSFLYISPVNANMQTINIPGKTKEVRTPEKMSKIFMFDLRYHETSL
jgi:hypothetical protein